MIQLHNADSKEFLKTLEENSIDSCVCDPPYELTSIVNRFGKENSSPAKSADYLRMSKGFMGKVWDGSGIQRDVDFWKEVYRVLKPGAYLLAFGGTRTHHRMTAAIEDAGFEIRDELCWLYGQGFPKSHDIGKKIDKAFNVEREVLGYRDNGVGSDSGSEIYNYNSGKSKASRFVPITAPETAEAKEWDGWGTALKPAFEPIVMARKPISEKNIALNVLRWRTGGINIDDSRIEIDGEIVPINKLEAWSGFGQEQRPEYEQYINTKGRWPSNLLLDEESAELLGSVSRFFYVAKPSKKEKGVACDHPTVKPIKLMEYLVQLVTPKNGTVLDPFMGSGTTGLACANLDYSFIGIEKEEEYYSLAVERMRS